MTKENRKDVTETIKTVHDLQSGDKVVVVYAKGDQIRTKLAYTFGYISNAMIKTPKHDDVMDVAIFGKLVGNYDTTFTKVWREVKLLPTEVGTIIGVDETTTSVRECLAILRHGGSWQGIVDPTIRLGASQITRWSHVNIEAAN